MNAAFFHDHKFRRDSGGGLYSTGGLSYPVLARYLDHFGALTVVGRAVPFAAGEHPDTLTPASGPGVDFRCVTLRSPLDVVLASEVRATVRAAVLAADCVIARLPSALGFLACQTAIRTDTPWAVEVVGCPSDALWNYGTRLTRAATLPYRWLQRHYVKHARHALYVSRRFLQDRYPCDGVSVGCPDVTLPAPDPEVLTRRLRRLDAGWSGRTVQLGLVGSLDVGFKGHETAIRALAAMRDRIPDFRLRILGAGRPERWRALAAECGIADKVVFDGTLAAGDAVFAWMDDLDVFLMPSLQETLGRALVEAMSRGCPALGSRETAIPEQLGDDCLHPAKDFTELGRLIVRMLANPEYMRLSALENFHRAGKYSNRLVDRTRGEFWSAVVQHARERACHANLRARSARPSAASQGMSRRGFAAAAKGERSPL